MVKSYVRMTISIPKDDKRWLDEHPEYSKSGLFRRLISILRADPEYIEKMEKRLKVAGIRQE